MNYKLIINMLVLTAILFSPLTIGQAQDILTGIQSPTGDDLPLYLPVIMVPRAQSIFGVETYNFTDDNMRKGEEVDAYWVRSFLFDWAKIESQEGVYDWSSVNTNNILQANKYRMQIIANVKFTPSWAQQYFGVSCGPIKPKKLDEFGNFVRAMVTKYSAPPYNIRYWEFFNEPEVAYNAVDPDNIYGCWGEPLDSYYGGRYFSEMLKVAYSAVKSVNPTNKVVIGGLLLDCDPDQPPPEGHTTCKSADFFEGILENGRGSNFDIVGFHSYVYTTDYYQRIYDEDAPNWEARGGQIVGKVNFLREVMTRYGVNKPLLMTELAMVGAQNATDCLTANESL